MLVLVLIALGYGAVLLNAAMSDYEIRKYQKQGLSREAAKARHEKDLENGGY